MNFAALVFWASFFIQVWDWGFQAGCFLSSFLLMIVAAENIIELNTDSNNFFVYKNCANGILFYLILFHKVVSRRENY